jgi:membrane-bound lytic murein transglycosylase B
VVRGAALIFVLLLLPGCGGERAARQVPAPTPSPTAAPTDLAATTDALHAAVDRWRASGSDAIPADVAALAAEQQRMYRRLGSSPRRARRAIRALPARLRREARDNVVARRELERITSVHVGPPPKIVVRDAEPPAALQRYYRRAEQRFRVDVPLLEAVNFVESAFGRLRNRSVSGARGPMQFMPATWRAYGLGGDISDPRDAILGAANYLHANGAPADERGALFHYNPSKHYVEAVARYAKRMRADERAFYEYYAWRVYVSGKPVPAG